MLRKNSGGFIVTVDKHSGLRVLNPCGLQDAFSGYKGRLSGSHTNLARVSAGSTEYHGLLSKPQAAQVDCGPDGVGTVGCLSAFFWPLLCTS